MTHGFWAVGLNGSLAGHARYVRADGKDVGRLAYLSLEALSPGRPAYTHVTEIT